jgi:hypothetical protein
MTGAIVVSVAVGALLFVLGLWDAAGRKRIIAAAATQIAAAYQRGYDNGYAAGYATVEVEAERRVDLQTLDLIARRLQTTNELPMN